MTCLTCTHFHGENKKMALHSYGNCDHKHKWEYLSINSPDCDKHKPVTAEVAKERMQWVMRTK